MRFEVIYRNSSELFYGKGSVFMHDTGLIFQGSIPQFTIPCLNINLFYKLLAYKFLLQKTTRTVPYSTIINYEHRRYYRDHEIIYRLPNGIRIFISFSINETKENNISFSNKLEEYITVIKSLSGN